MVNWTEAARLPESVSVIVGVNVPAADAVPVSVAVVVEVPEAHAGRGRVPRGSRARFGLVCHPCYALC